MPSLRPGLRPATEVASTERRVDSSRRRLTIALGLRGWILLAQVDWDAALLVVEDRDELESRAKFFVVLARCGHAYVVGVLNEPFDSRNAESELAECESSVVAMTRRASCGWRSSPGDFRPHAHTTRVCQRHLNTDPLSATED